MKRARSEVAKSAKPAVRGRSATPDQKGKVSTKVGPGPSGKGSPARVLRQGFCGPRQQGAESPSGSEQAGSGQGPPCGGNGSTARRDARSLHGRR